MGGVKGSQGRGYAMTDRVTGNTTTELRFLKTNYMNYKTPVSVSS